MSADLDALSKELEAAIERARHPRTPTPAPLPPDLAALFCDVCGNFMSSAGCQNSHNRQERLL